MNFARRGFFKTLAALGAAPILGRVASTLPVATAGRSAALLKPGSGASATVTVVSGAVTEFTIIDSGSGYTSAPTIVFSG